MEFLDLTLESPAENLALDEALLDAAESGEGADEVLRLWESPHPIVVLGRTSKIDQEVHVQYCRREKIPVLRRASGGASVVAGPGCLMYAVVLSYQRRPELRPLDQTHAFVLEKMATAIRSLATGSQLSPSQQALLGQVEPRGTSDLAIGDRKFSGNSLRCKRTHFLYHGTLLHDFPLGLADQCLQSPPRQPDYRRERDHGEFITNLHVGVASLRAAIKLNWSADNATDTWPRHRVAQLVSERYGLSSWNQER